MSLIFNEAALNNLLNSPDGPLGTRLRFVAEKIESNYNEAVDEVWENQPRESRPEVGFDITFGDLGIQAEVGLLDTHGRTRVDKNGKERPTTAGYLAAKFNNAAEGWAVELIMSGWDDEL